MHLSSHGCCGSGVSIWLSWESLTSSLPCCRRRAGQSCGLVSRVNLGSSCFQAHSHGCRLVSIPDRLLGREPQFLVARQRLPPWVSHPTDLSQGCLGTWLHKSEPAESLEPAEKPRSFYNLTSAVTSHPLCRVLFIRSKSQSPTITRGEGLSRGWPSGGRDHWKAACHGSLGNFSMHTKLGFFKKPIFCILPLQISRWSSRLL